MDRTDYRGAAFAGRGIGVNSPLWGVLLPGGGASAHRGVAADARCGPGRFGKPTSRTVDDGRTRGRGDRPIVPTNRGGNLLSPDPRRGPAAAGQIAGATGGDEPGPAVAAAGQAH